MLNKVVAARKESQSRNTCTKILIPNDVANLLLKLRCTGDESFSISCPLVRMEASNTASPIKQHTDIHTQVELNEIIRVEFLGTNKRIQRNEKKTKGKEHHKKKHTQLGPRAIFVFLQQRFLENKSHETMKAFHSIIIQTIVRRGSH